MQTMETRPVVPDRKLLARLVLIREEARNMMGGGILDERNDRGFTTLPESEVFPAFIQCQATFILNLFFYSNLSMNSSVICFFKSLPDGCCFIVFLIAWKLF